MPQQRSLLPEMGGAVARPQMKQMARPAGKRPDFRIAALADDEAEVRIYDAIGWYAVSADDVVEQLAKIKASTIHLRINSPGGDVFDGIAMYNALVRHPARVVTHVDGVAASAASIIALAGDEVLMAEGSYAMVHSAWSLAMGNARDMRKVAELLEGIDASLAGIYSRQMDITPEEAMQLMVDETWLNAEDAVAKGFADGHEEQPAVEASFDLSLFQKTPDRLAAAQRGSARETPKPQTIRELETLLRDAGGFSRAEAQRIAASGFGTTTPARDEPPVIDLTPLRDLADGIRSLTQR